MSNSTQVLTTSLMATNNVERGTELESSGNDGGTDWTTAPVKSCNARPTDPNRKKL
jgi:hypothetical protein